MKLSRLPLLLTVAALVTTRYYLGSLADSEGEISVVDLHALNAFEKETRPH